MILLTKLVLCMNVENEINLEYVYIISAYMYKLSI